MRSASCIPAFGCLAWPVCERPSSRPSPSRWQNGRPPSAALDRSRSVLLTGIGAAVGCAAAGFQVHPRRSLGLVPLAATGLAVLLAAAVSDAAWSGICLTLGLFVGIAGPALRALPSGRRPARLPAAPIDAAAAVLMLLPFALIENGALAPAGRWCVALAAASGVAAVAAWGLLAVPTLELAVEWFLWPMYRIRTHGPGAGRIPRRGPLLIVANHSSYGDPFWLSVIAPRKTTPMMTSVFYDLPIIRWLMVHAVGAIRVQVGAFRREAPELREAAAVLRRGGCVLLFPEGGLRKREDAAAGAVRPGRLAHPQGGAANAGGRLLGRGRLGQLRLLPRRPADEEQAPRLATAHRRRRGRTLPTRPRRPGRPPHHPRRPSRAPAWSAAGLGLPIPEEPEKKEGADDEQGGEATEADAHQINP